MNAVQQPGEQHAEAELRESQRALAVLMSNLPGMAYRCRNDPDWTMVFVSDGCLALTGHAPADLVDNRTVSYAELIHPDDRNSVWSEVQAALADDRPFQLTYRIRTAASQEKWVWEQGRGVRTPGGELVALEGFITDVTERHQADAAMRENQRFLTTLVRNLPGYVYRCKNDRDFTPEFISEGVTALTGWTPDDFLVHRTVISAIHPEDQQRVWSEVQAALAAGQRFAVSYRIRTKAGQEKWVWEQGCGVHDPSGRLLALEGFITDVTGHQRAQQALQSSERHYRLLFERNLAGVYRSTLAGRVLDCNDAFARILGYESREDVLSRSAADLYFNAGQREKFVAKLRERRSLTNHEGYLRRKDGGIVWTLANVSLVEVEGEPQIEGTLVDITERKRMERELARERDFLSSLMENTPLCIYFKDVDSRFTRVNQASVVNLGLEAAEAVVGTSDFNYFSEEQALEYFHDEQQIMETGRPLVDKLERQLRQDGTVRWFLTTKMPLYGKDGKVTGLVGVSTDVTERNQAEETLRKSLSILRVVTEGTQDVVFFKDREGRYVMINSAGAALMGRPVEEVTGKRDRELFGADIASQLEEDDRGVMATGETRTFERVYHAAAGPRTYLVTQSPYRDQNGAVNGVIGITHDITDRKRLEEQLRQAQKMEAIGQLAGGVAHDFNNLLTAILGNVSLLLSSLPAGDPNRELLAETETAALRAAELTRQLLGFSRQTVLRLQPIDLTQVIHETVRIVRRTIDPRIKIEVETAEDLWAVQADAGQMNQVLMNLCLNARDAMPQGGLLRLEASRLVMDEVSARRDVEKSPGQFVRLRVRDTGQGIPPEIRQRIFDPFFTTKEPGKGTGLGLAMVFGIVKQHRGWIECQSEVGQGSTFDIYLPRFREGLKEPAEAVLPLVARGGSETILIIDDEAIIRNLGRTILQRQGYQILLAEDGEEGLRVYERDQKRIDLVILDLVMPRLSGRDVLRRLRAIDPEVYVLFSSGYSADQVTETEKEGVLGFVHKPYRPQDLVSTVRSVLDRAKARRQ